MVCVINSPNVQDINAPIIGAGDNISRVLSDVIAPTHKMLDMPKVSIQTSPFIRFLHLIFWHRS
jgi:hypothetical protein